jgi:hypothetical protein
MKVMEGGKEEMKSIFSFNEWSFFTPNHVFFSEGPTG